MLYHISREGQNYGPYTLEDLQRYVASGNVLLTDMARAEDGTEWVPVSQILGGGVPKTHAVDLPGTDSLVIVEIPKVRKTNPRYPRPATQAKGRAL